MCVPFNMGSFNNIKTPFWFYYFKQNYEDKIIKEELDKAIKFHYNLNNNIKNINNVKNILRVSKIFYDF
jgi:hypothetical protein